MHTIIQVPLMCIYVALEYICLNNSKNTFVLSSEMLLLSSYVKVPLIEMNFFIYATQSQQCIAEHDKTLRREDVGYVLLDINAANSYDSEQVRKLHFVLSVVVVFISVVVIVLYIVVAIKISTNNSIFTQDHQLLLGVFCFFQITKCADFRTHDHCHE